MRDVCVVECVVVWHYVVLCGCVSVISVIVGVHVCVWCVMCCNVLIIKLTFSNANMM